MNTFENIKIAWESLRSNFLRSLLTLMIIALGLMSLIGILTAIDGLLKSINDNFNRLGSNSFTIQRTNERIKTKTAGWKRIRSKAISYTEATNFSNKYDYSNAKIGIDLFAKSNAVVKFRDLKTENEISLRGINLDYLNVSSFEIENGRGFMETELQSGKASCIIGSEIVDKLFNGKSDKAIGQTIQINSSSYKIIGSLKSKGSSFGGSQDGVIFIPLIRARIQYGSPNSNYKITVSIPRSVDLDQAINQATGAMRIVRNLKPIDKNDFEMVKSSGLMDELKSMTTNLRFATIAIGLMTLLGAAIGLMNIMLVSVTERTKEIGIAKALGATRRNILIQFLTESILITLVGGIIGIILGIIIGNIVTFYLGGTFIFPVVWVMIGFILCVITGIISGLYPALKASRLDPIESLRYE